MDSIIKSSTMDSAFLVSKPKYFTLKKCLLASVLCINILLHTGALFFRETLVAYCMSMITGLSAEDEARVNDFLLIALPVVCLLAILTDLTFLIGVLRHSVCLCTTYTILVIIVALVALTQAFRYPIFWINVVVGSVVGLISWMYVRDLKFIHLYMHSRKRLRQEA